MRVLAVATLAYWALVAASTVVNLLVFRKLPRLERSATAPPPRVSIVIPARDEEASLGETLDRALALDHPDLEVVVVDDASSDGTPDVVRRRSGDPRLRSLRVVELPEGWLGKPHALARGATVATGDWLLFIDADVRLEPGAVTSALAAAERLGLDHLGAFPEMERQGFWEEIMLPQFAVLFFFLPSFLARLPALRSLAFGVGGFNLVRRRAYEAIGGHARLRASVIDDVRLAVELKRAGFSTRLFLGSNLAHLRMYRGLREIVEGLTKNTHALGGGSWLLPVGGVLLGLVTNLAPWIWPFWALAAPAAALSPPGLVLAASLGLMLAARGAVQLRMGYPLWPTLFQPLMSLVHLVIVARSLRMAFGEGVVRWRGREYPREGTRF